jgi:heme A synthase
MKCFNHDGADGVAICKNCNKALCHACAADVGNGVACAGACEQEVIALNELIRRNRTSSQRTGYAYHRNAVICALLAALFVYLSLDAYKSGRQPLLIVTAGSAMVFLLAAFFNYSAGQKFMRGGS